MADIILKREELRTDFNTEPRQDWVALVPVHPNPRVEKFNNYFTPFDDFLLLTYRETSQSPRVNISDTTAFLLVALNLALTFGLLNIQHLITSIGAND